MNGTQFLRRGWYHLYTTAHAESQEDSISQQVALGYHKQREQNVEDTYKAEKQWHFESTTNENRFGTVGNKLLRGLKLVLRLPI